jgi:hypothetical protein
MLTFVSCMIDLNEVRERKTNTYFELFRKLASSGIKIHLFVSKSFEKYLVDFQDNVYVEFIELEDLILYKKLQNVKKLVNISLPVLRNEIKDTENYMVVQNSKVEFVYRASEKNVYNSSHFAWIDFGILHIIKNEEETLNNLVRLSTLKLKNGILIVAGGQLKEYHVNNLFHTVIWRFLGGFFITDKPSINIFYKLYSEYFEKMLISSQKMIWEINFWVFLEVNTQWKPMIYIANHDDSMLIVPNEFFELSS